MYFTFVRARFFVFLAVQLHTGQSRANAFSPEPGPVCKSEQGS